MSFPHLGTDAVVLGIVVLPNTYYTSFNPKFSFFTLMSLISLKIGLSLNSMETLQEM